MEAAETNKYLLAKTYFNCREFDRCAAVFMPATLPKGSVASSSQTNTPKAKGSSSVSEEEVAMSKGYPGLSQKALFLSLYAKYLSGEKRKDEYSEQILGPTDNAAAINRELSGISRILEARLNAQTKRNTNGQGWLEYLYGIILAKGKSDDQARVWLLKSVNLYPFNWGAWQELCALLGTTDEVRLVGLTFAYLLLTTLIAQKARTPAEARPHDLCLSDIRKPRAFPSERTGSAGA